MMIWLGCLALMQAGWLPGWLVTWRWRAPSWWTRVLVSFTLSLLINYFVVTVLVALHLFQRPVVLGLIVAELIIYGWLLWRTRASFKFNSIRFSYPIDLMGEVHAPQWFGRILLIGISGLAIIAIATMIGRVLSVNPGVFNVWDDFISFNKWALAFYAGHFPVKTQFYPQLIPANWAMMYRVMGTSDIQLFAKALMGLFPVFILTSFVDLFYQTKKITWLLGLIFTTVLMLGLASSFIGSGYTDIPAAFFAFLAYAVVAINLEEGRWSTANLAVALVVAVAAAMTKQAGLFMLFPLLVWLALIGHRAKINISRITIGLLGALLLFGLLISPWYAYKLWDIQQGRDTSEIASVESALERAIGKQTLFGKWSYGAQSAGIMASGQLLQSVHLASVVNNKLVWSISHQPVSRPAIFAVVWGLVILLGLAFANPVAGLATLTVTIPFFLIWATKYSYDFRNLTVALPFWGVATGFGVIALINWITSLLGVRALTPKRSPEFPQTATVSVRHVRYLGLGLVLVIVGLVTYAQISYPVTKIYAFNEQRMREVGMVNINDALYQYYNTHGLSGKIRTMYQPAAYLPQLKDYVIADGSSLSLEAIKQYESDPNIHYILWWEGTIEPDAATYIQDQIVNGKYTALFNVGDSTGYYNFVRIKPE